MNTCQHCGGSFTATQAHAKYCGKTCKDGAKYLRQKASGISQARYQRKVDRGYSKTPVVRARVNAYRAEARANGVPWATNRNHRKRARSYGVAYEHIDFQQLFNDAGWVCGICKDPIDPDLTHPDPWSVSVDHIIPMALGGPHLRSNVQPSHLVCNCAKADRVTTKEGR